MKIFWKEVIGEDVGDPWLQEIFWFDGQERKYSHVHAFSFVDDEHMVFCHHIRGHYGPLGGGIEEGETNKEALEREIMEEGNAKLLAYGPVFVLRHTKVADPKEQTVQLACWADVELLPGDKFEDPGGDVDGREVVALGDVPAKLGWGEAKVKEIVKAMVEARAKTR